MDLRATRVLATVSLFFATTLFFAQAYAQSADGLANRGYDVHFVPNS